MCLCSSVILFICLTSVHATVIQYDDVMRDIINITYVYVEQAPYEKINNNEWKFEFGNMHTDKTLHGIISRSINFISKKHCPHFRFIPHRVDNTSQLTRLVLKKDVESLNKEGIPGDYFVFSPLPVSALLYYNMTYEPRLFTWDPMFASSDGIVIVRRVADVDISQRLIRALGKSYIILAFISCILPIVSIIMWTLDRKIKDHTHPNPIKVVFSKMYLAVVTLTTVGYGDIVPMTVVGKVLSVMWMGMSIILVACLTSLITSDMVDSSIDIHHKNMAVVQDTWDEFLARLMVNHVRKSDNIVKFGNYIALMDQLSVDKTLFGGLVDYSVACMMQHEMQERNLVPVHLLENTAYNMGIAYHHPTRNHSIVMQELFKCLHLENEFKIITKDMLVPRLSIESIYLRPSYREWIVILGSVFVGVVIFGIVVELLHRKFCSSNKEDVDGIDVKQLANLDEETTL